MTALTTGRATPTRAGQLVPVPVAGNVIIRAGALVVANASGYACPGKTAIGLTVLGIAQDDADTTGQPDGAQLVTIERGMLARFANLPGDAVTQASFGRACYIADDQTVAATSGGNTRSLAGSVFGIEPAGVWVAL